MTTIVISGLLENAIEIDHKNIIRYIVSAEGTDIYVKSDFDEEEIFYASLITVHELISLIRDVSCNANNSN
jgi:hypothetical protein